MLMCGCLACTSFKPISTNKQLHAEEIIELVKPDQVYRFYYANNKHLQVKVLKVDSTYVYGSYHALVGDKLRKVAYKESFQDLATNADKISVREFDLLKTIGTVICISPLLFYLMALISLNSDS